MHDHADLATPFSAFLPKWTKVDMSALLTSKFTFRVAEMFLKSFGVCLAIQNKPKTYLNRAHTTKSGTSKPT